MTDSLKEQWAKEIIEDSKNPLPQDQDNNWICENCGEEHSPQFSDCWNCQSIKAF